MTRGLGKGLGALLPSDLNTAQLLNEGESIKNVFINDIIPGIEQPRINFEDESLQELANSIKQYGIIQPLIVSPAEHNKYSIIAGERRWRAGKMVKLKNIPVIVRTFADQEKLEIALIENVQRVDLSPIEQAISIERLHQQFNMTYSMIGKRLGKASTTVNNIVRLLQLPESARSALSSQNITEGHARAILAIKDFPNKQDELLQYILAKGWSVRQAEQFAIAVKESKQTATTKHKRLKSKTPETIKLEKYLKTNVSLKRLARGGVIEIVFKNDDHLDDLLKKLST